MQKSLQVEKLRKDTIKWQKRSKQNMDNELQILIQLSYLTLLLIKWIYKSLIKKLSTDNGVKGLMLQYQRSAWQSLKHLHVNQIHSMRLQQVQSQQIHQPYLAKMHKLHKCRLVIILQMIWPQLSYKLQNSQMFVIFQLSCSHLQRKPV